MPTGRRGRARLWSRRWAARWWARRGSWRTTGPRAGTRRCRPPRQRPRSAPPRPASPSPATQVSRRRPERQAFWLSLAPAGDRWEISQRFWLILVTFSFLFHRCYRLCLLYKNVIAVHAITRRENGTAFPSQYSVFLQASRQQRNQIRRQRKLPTHPASRKRKPGECFCFFFFTPRRGGFSSRNTTKIPLFRNGFDVKEMFLELGVE